jgi:hypothetical protein
MLRRTWSAGIGSSSEVPAQKQIDKQECHRQEDYRCSNPTSAAGLVGGFVASSNVVALRIQRNAPNTEVHNQNGVLPGTMKIERPMPSSEQAFKRTSCLGASAGGTRQFPLESKHHDSLDPSLSAATKKCD